MARVGSVDVALRADATQLVSGFRVGSQQVDRFGRRVDTRLAQTESRFRRLALSATAMQGAVVAAFTRMAGPLMGVGLLHSIRRITGEMGALANAADVAGLQSSETLQIIREAVELTGGTAEQADRAMADFATRVAEAATGTGRLHEVLVANNVALRDSEGNLRTQEALLSDFADMIRNTRSEADQLRLAQIAMGERGGRAMVNALRQGSDGLAEFERNAREAGRVIEDDLVRRARDFDDAAAMLANTLTTRLKVAILETATAGVDGFERWHRILQRIARLIPDISGAVEDLANLMARIPHFQPGGPLGTMLRMLDDAGRRVEGMLPDDRAARGRDMLRRGEGRPMTGVPDDFGQRRETVIPGREETERRARAVREVASAYDTATESVRRAIEAMQIEAETVGMTEEAARRYRTEQELINTAKREGREITPELKAEIAALADEYATSAHKVDELTERLEEQRAAAESAARAVSGFARDLIGDFSSAEEAAKRLLQRILDIVLQLTVLGPLERGITSALGFSGGGAVGFARGGVVRGPGTATSDSIPARLSDGEFVINAAATARHRALLEAINRGAPGFNAGGIALRNATMPMPRFASMEMRRRLVPEKPEVNLRIDTSSIPGASAEVKQGSDGEIEVMVKMVEGRIAENIDRGGAVGRSIGKAFNLTRRPR